MGERIQPPTPVLHVQYQLLGGNRRMFAVLGVTTFVLVVGFVTIVKLPHGAPMTMVAGYVLNFLGSIQGVILVFGGCNAVYRAVLRDYETKMLESHRLTPMSNLAVVLGYLLGSTLQVMALFVLIAVFGVVVSFLASSDVKPWVYGNLLHLSGAVTLWAAVAFFGMRPAKPFTPAPVLVGIGALTAALAAVPALGLLCNTYTVFLALSFIWGMATVPRSAIIIVVAVNGVFTIFWLLASAVKYRRPDLPALNGMRGLVLLALVMLIGTAGIVAYRDATKGGLGPFLDETLPRVQWIATMIFGFVLSAVPIAGAVRCRVLGDRGTSLRGWADRVSPGFTSLVCALIVCLLMAAAGSSIWPDLLGPVTAVRAHRVVVMEAWAVSGAACLLGALCIRSVFEIGYRCFKSPKTIVMVFVFLAWALPPMLDLSRAELFRPHGESASYSALMGLSPAGTIIAQWSLIRIPIWPGLAAQLGLAGVLWLFAWRSRKKTRVEAEA